MALLIGIVAERPNSDSSSANEKNVNVKRQNSKAWKISRKLLRELPTFAICDGFELSNLVLGI